MSLGTLDRFRRGGRGKGPGGDILSKCGPKKGEGGARGKKYKRGAQSTWEENAFREEKGKGVEASQGSTY